MEDPIIHAIGCVARVRRWRPEASTLSELADRSYLAFQCGPWPSVACLEEENESCFGFGATPSRPLSCCCGLNQSGGRDNGWVLAMLAALCVAPVQRKCIPLSLSSGWFLEAAHERTLTA
jgi:hypothetical protein